MSTHVMGGTEAKSRATGERVRAVLSGESEVCHVWAARTQTHGRFRAVYFSGDRLYSYGSHYVIGELRDKGATVLLNAEPNSMTTNGHRRAAEHATRHLRQLRIPDLTEALKILDNLESYRRSVASERKQGADFENPESYASRCKARVEYERGQLRRFIKSHALGGYSGSFDDESAVYLLKLAGYPAASWQAIQREAERERKAEKAAEAKRKAAAALADAKLFGDASDSDFGEYMPADSYRYQRDMAAGDPGRLADGNGKGAQAAFAKRVAAAHKASKAAGYTARTARLWKRVKQAREWAAGFEQRERQRKAAELRAEFESARERGELASLAAWRFGGDMRAEIEAAQAGREAEQAAADYDAWRETPTAVKRPDSRRYAEGSTQRAVLEGFEREEMETEAAAFERWRVALADAKRRGDPKPAWQYASTHGVTASSFATRWPDIAERLGGDPWREALHGWTKAEAEAKLAAEAEAERLRKASEAEKAAAWQAGASLHAMGASRLSDPDGGALLRIEGDGDGAELVTSHGARVPLSHAIKAFRFVKLIREQGGQWSRNGRTVRVGHYQLDSIDPDGFNAGCHRINWPEIERVAKLAGVFDCEPSDAAAEPSGKAA